MFSYSLPLPKVSAKNIYYCGQNPGKENSEYTYAKFGDAQVVCNLWQALSEIYH